MRDNVKKVLSLLEPLFTTRAAGTYILLFAIVIGVATFIENDFGTSAAQKVVYKAWWFELLLLLFATAICVNIVRFRMVQQRKWALLTFHLAIIVILLGSAVTRYFGYEGMMHIREGDTANSFLSADTYLNFEVMDGDKRYTFDEPVLFASLGSNKWSESYLVDGHLIEARVNRFIPNPEQVLESADDGVPIIKVVIVGMGGREEYFVHEGETRQLRNGIYNFSDEYIPEAFNILFRNDSILIKSDKTMTQMIMTAQQLDTLHPGPGYHMLRPRAMYSNGQANVVFGDFHPKGTVKIKSKHRKVKGESVTALDMDFRVNGETGRVLVYGQKGYQGRPSVFKLGGLDLAVSYGSKRIYLPFAIKLYKFIMERYPGTDSAASYASEVQLVDARKDLRMDYRIFMNNILNYGGYRFFQSSFDKDEKGTYLSVNFDFWGTWISYIGYGLLTLGLILSLFSKKSRFYQVTQKIKNMRAQHGTFIFVLLLSMFGTMSHGQKVINESQASHIVSTDHADAFAKLVVQDHKGRMKPIHTLNREIMRKVHRKESFDGLTADQVILGMLAHDRHWNQVPMIKLGKHEKIREILNVTGDYASYNDFFDHSGRYILRDEVRRAYDLQPIDRTAFEKELMKLDERVNISNMVFTGRFFRIIPVPGDSNNTWVSNTVHSHGPDDVHDPVAEKFFASYLPALNAATVTNDYTLPDKMISELAAYQRNVGGDVVPSENLINGEILLNNSKVFGRLSVYYILLGLGFLICLFISVFKHDMNLSVVYKILFGLTVLGFIFHTFGLGLRWYVSGRAPWSNGYESMIYIAWTTTLAGLIFTRKSFGGLAATMVLAATVLLVATLSYLDPEITPLVPVLRSYWLTIHVSLEAGSYGFLMLGAIIGFLNLILMIFLSERNKERIKRIVTEMSYISELTLIGGLIMVSVGTYLGGIWANESWGRYWGWDAKETWALVTILVYAFILHMRIIPKLNGLYLYNLMTLFGWATVIMTYYGVNYYLSGLHSYAAGDPVPIPNWVYMAVVAVIIVSSLAYWRKRQFPVIT